MLSHFDKRTLATITTTFTSSTMQALADIAIQDNTYLNQVNRLLSSLIKEGSPAMKARGKKLLLTLKKIKDETKD
jgi:hypothetical protein